MKDIKIKLITRYGNLNPDINALNDILIEETCHWLNDYADVLSVYQSALDKYNNGIFERNILDDLRLSLEILLKKILNNERSLENQLPSLGLFIQGKGGSREFGNMFQKLVEYYSRYQNIYVKHNDLDIEEEIEFILEITSSFMKHLVKTNKLER